RRAGGRRPLPRPARRLQGAAVRLHPQRAAAAQPRRQGPQEGAARGDPLGTGPAVTPRPRPLVHGETRLVDVDGHRLRVSVAGEGPPLLLLNGFGVSIELWNPLREA